MERQTNNEAWFAGLELLVPAGRHTVSEAKARERGVSKSGIDVARLTAGMARQEEAAYREFYARYFDRLLRYLLVVTGGREDAAREALQTTMLRIVRHARRFESEEAFWGWLTVLARSSVVDAERKRRRYLALLERFFKSAPGGSVNSEADGQFMALLNKNLAALAPEDRELIERKYFETESVREIAGEVGATEKAVESRLGRIRRQLKAAVLAALKHENES